MKHFLLTLWQLPQTLLGAIIIILFHGVRLGEYDTKTANLLALHSVRYGNVYIIKIRRKYDTARHPVLVSLGRFVIIEESYLLSLMPSLFSSAETQKVFLRLIKHEQGHCRQSVMLGPLYLIIVGIPSALLNALTQLQSSRYTILKKIGHEAYYNYYRIFPESWADRLGGVKDRRYGG